MTTFLWHKAMVFLRIPAMHASMTSIVNVPRAPCCKQSPVLHAQLFVDLCGRVHQKEKFARRALHCSVGTITLSFV